MSSLEFTLQRLAGAFVVRDVMVAQDNLVSAPDLATAEDLLNRFPDYDVVPIRDGGHLTAYLQRGASKVHRITLNDLVSDSTSLLDLVDVLESRSFVFVLTRQKVSGFVHFSDLNKPLLKLPYFVLLEALERDVGNRVARHVDNDLIERLFGHARYEQVRKKMETMQQHRSNLDLVNLLYFQEVLLCGLNLQFVTLDQPQIQMLAKVRTRVCHASADPLVKSQLDVKELSRCRLICASVLTQGGV